MSEDTAMKNALEKVSEAKRTGKRLNQIGDVSDGNMDISKWFDQWERGETRFHLKNVHPMLQKHYNRMVERKDRGRIFVPLCGKTLDMKWLADKGHEVVGLEGVETACRQFYEEHNIDYTESKIQNPDAIVFRSKGELKITLYCCDFFAINSETVGTFDYIWDRGSFAAINVDQRERYASIILDLMSETTNYMLDCFTVDHDVFSGPPHTATPEMIEALYGDRCDIELLQSRDLYGDWQRTWGATYFWEHVRLLKLKSGK